MTLDQLAFGSLAASVICFGVFVGYGIRHARKQAKAGLAVFDPKPTSPAAADAWSLERARRDAELQREWCRRVDANLARRRNGVPEHFDVPAFLRKQAE